LYFRDRRLDVKSLPILIRGAAGEGAERKVYLAVDARAKYGDAAAVLNAIGKAEIREICILAYKPEQ
jgi:biopolymer transport protein ExbD